MKSLEELKMQKRRLVARESLRQHSMQRDREKSKLKSEIRSLKYAGLKETLTNIKGNVKNVAGHVKGRVGMARERIGKIQKSIEASEKRRPQRKNVGFQGFNMKLITGQ